MLASLLQLAFIASLTLPIISATIPTISVKGAKFFVGGQQFFLKGVAYQGTPADPLVDTAQCTSDAEAMAAIGTNSIRVYHVDPYADHDGCMSAFESKGIYVWLDLDTFTTAIVQATPTWTQWQFGNFTEVMDVFQKYDNLAGFWVGNEVINTAGGSIAAPYIKAATADMKSYMAAKNYRTIPIGYSAADIAQLRPELQNYLACGDDYSQSIDFYGLNAYEWCGQATFETSGYSDLQAMSEGYSIPIFFSETGCNIGGARTFEDQIAIFGENMVGTWSGSIIYEWVQEVNDYGLVNYPNGQIYSGAPIPIQPDYNNLAGVWKNVNPSAIAEDSYSPSFSAPACPGPTNGWLINGNVPLPTLGSSVVQAEVASIKPTLSPSNNPPAPSTSVGQSPTIPSSNTVLVSFSSNLLVDGRPSSSVSVYHPFQAYLGSRKLLNRAISSEPSSNSTAEVTTTSQDPQSSPTSTGPTSSPSTSSAPTSSPESSSQPSSSYTLSPLTSLIYSFSTHPTQTIVLNPSVHITLVNPDTKGPSTIYSTVEPPKESTSTSTITSVVVVPPSLQATVTVTQATTTTTGDPSLQTKGGKKGVGSTLEIPAAVAGGILGLAMLVFG